MEILTKAEGLILISFFGAAMLLLVLLRTRGSQHTEGFLVADRNVSLWRGALSIAVSWIWAPAIFICSMQAYQHGLPGIFWFTAPNILCFFIFAPLAVKLRKLMPEGYTLPQYIDNRFGRDSRTHLAFLSVYYLYQFSAITINALAGGYLLNLISGIPISTAIITISGIALGYSLISGLKASIFTDLLQMMLVLVLALVLVPWCFSDSANIILALDGLGGVSGEYASLFNPKIAFIMGIPMTISLIAGPIADQMFFQRTMAVKAKVVGKTFVYGGIIFGFIPIILSGLGFLGAGLERAGLLAVSDPQLVGPIVIGHILPKGALYAFCLMAFAGLCSTMDSAFCAGSSLSAIDLYKRYFKPNAGDKEILKVSRLTMILLAFGGTGVALLQPKLLWVFLIYGALCSSVLFPTLFAVYWKRITAKACFLAVTSSLVIGLPFSIYANIKEDANLIVYSALLSVTLSLAVCLLASFRGALEKRNDTIPVSSDLICSTNKN